MRKQELTKKEIERIQVTPLFLDNVPKNPMWEIGVAAKGLYYYAVVSEYNFRMPKLAIVYRDLTGQNIMR